MASNPQDVDPPFSGDIAGLPGVRRGLGATATPDSRPDIPDAPSTVQPPPKLPPAPNRKLRPPAREEPTPQPKSSSQ